MNINLILLTAVIRTVLYILDVIVFPVWFSGVETPAFPNKPTPFSWLACNINTAYRTPWYFKSDDVQAPYN